MVLGRRNGKGQCLRRGGSDLRMQYQHLDQLFRRVGVPPWNSRRPLNNMSSSVTPKSWRDRSRFRHFLITHRLAVSAPRAPRSLESPEQQGARGARPLLWSAVAGMMLALTFTCRALLVFLILEPVQTDRASVGPGFFILLTSSHVTSLASLKL